MEATVAAVAQILLASASRELLQHISVQDEIAAYEFVDGHRRGLDYFDLIPHGLSDRHVEKLESMGFRTSVGCDLATTFGQRGVNPSLVLIPLASVRLCQLETFSSLAALLTGPADDLIKLGMPR